MLHVLVANLACDLRTLTELAGTRADMAFTYVGDGSLPDSVRVIREPSRAGWMDLFETHDVFLTSISDTIATQLCREAMAHGCVPVLAGGLVPDFVIGGRSGFVVPAADDLRILDPLVRIATDSDLSRTIALNAYNCATRGKRRIKDMVGDYIELFQRVRYEVASGDYRRPRTSIHLPARVDGIDIFPFRLNHKVKGLGAFPTRDDFNSYLEEVESGVARRT